MQKIKKCGGKKTFVVIFEALNVHLTKEVGSIPYVLARDYNYDSYIFCHDVGQKFTNEYALQFLKIIKTKPIKYLQTDNFRKFYIVSYLRFLMKNAKSIDILQLYHNTMLTKLTAFIYKLLNPKGFVYIKLDATNDIVTKMKDDYFTKKIFDLVSVESIGIFNGLLNSAFKRYKHKLVYATSGLDNIWMQKNGFSGVTRNEKENLIITVGRIGTEQKNNELMLDALNGMDLGDWKFVFIGSIEKCFIDVIERFYEANPKLKENVVFTGEITDRNEIFFWYKKAKVFCFTSRYESWGLALCDALYFGCEIISTRFDSYDDLTDFGKLGYEIKTVSDLKTVLKKITANQIDPCANMEKIIAHSKRFFWTDICGKLDMAFNVARS